MRENPQANHKKSGKTRLGMGGVRVIEAFQTDRLTACRLGHGDFDDIFRMHTDPVVMATLGGRVWSEAETHAFLARVDAHWEEHGFGLWAVRHTATGAFAGRAGLRRLPLDGVAEDELLYGYSKEWWGQGIATEMAASLAHIAFSRLRFPTLVSFTLPTNTASRRVMEKTGFVYERNFIYSGLSHVLYRQRNGVAA